jgi:hypothetical protein
LNFGEHYAAHCENHRANLARLELKVMLDEVLNRLRDLEVAGKVQRLYSNTVAGIKHMPLRSAPSRGILASLLGRGHLDPTERFDLPRARN